MKKMYSLTQLLEMSDIVKFKTTQTDADPETGRITWDVDYYTDFQEVVTRIEALLHDLDKARRMTKVDDPIIIKAIEAIKAAKTSIVRRLHQKYPELLKKD